MPPPWAPGVWLAARRESRSAKRRRAAALQIRPFPHRDRRHSTPGSWPQRAIREPWDLSMNRKGRAGSPLPAALPGLPDGEPYKAGAQRSARPTKCPGSGSQCAVCEPWRLHERSGTTKSTKDTKKHKSSGLRDLRDLRGRSPRSSGSQCVSKFWKTRLSMNHARSDAIPIWSAVACHRFSSAPGRWFCSHARKRWQALLLANGSAFQTN